MNGENQPDQRRERRFATCDQALLQTETFIEFNDPIHGSVIDISSHGLRLLTEGAFTVGQPFVTELKTDQLHGVFPGIILHIEPWVEGKSVLGCQLLEPIPEDVLENLARDKVINRRSDDRVAWRRAATMSWELQPDEVDIAIQDCSLGGLRIMTGAAIPENACVRVSIDVGDGEKVTIDARIAWQSKQDDGCAAGLTFTKHQPPSIIRQAVVEGNRRRSRTPAVTARPAMRSSIMIAAVAAICGALVLQTGILG